MKSDEIKILEFIQKDKDYQIKLLIVACCIWGFLDLFSLSLGILEIKPIVEIVDKDKRNSYYGPLEYNQCNMNYDIIELNPSSIVNYFKIFCNPYLVALIGAINFTGVLAGTIIAPFIVDKYGRKRPIIYACLLHSIVLFSCTYAKNIQTMYFFIFFCGFSNLISHLAIFILLNEVASKENRAFYSTIVFNSFAIFGILFSIEFFYLSYWKYVVYITSVCVFVIFILCIFFIQESPRYLLLKHDSKFKEKILKKIFSYDRENKPTPTIKKKSSNKLEGFKSPLLNKERKIEEEVLSDLSKKKGPLKILLTNTKIKGIFLSMCLMWFSVAGTYYGVLIMLKDTEGNLYLTYSIMYALEIIANFFAAYIIEHPSLGRKKSLIFLHLVTLIVCLFNTLLNKSYFHTILVILLRFLVATTFSINYVYSTEVYPTDIRAQGLAFNALFGRLGSIISPFLVEILGYNFFIYCSILFLFCFLLSFILKETYDTELEQYTTE